MAQTPPLQIAARARPAWSRAALVGACTGLLAVLAALALVREERLAAAREVAATSARISDRLRDVVFDIVHDAESLALLVTLKPDLDGDAFRAAARLHRERRDSVGGILWIARVRHAERGAFEARMRAGDAPAYRISDRDASGAAVPAAVRDEYFPSLYMEPRPADARAQGFDLGASAERLRAMQAARDTGSAAMTGRIRLVTSPQRPDGVQIFVPVFRDGRRPAVLAERREALVGFVSALLPAGELIDATIADILPKGWRFELHVPVPAEDRRLIHAVGPERPGGPEYVAPLRVLGVGFETVLRAPAPAPGPKPAGVLAAGLLIAGLLWFVLVQRHRTHREREGTALRHRAELRAADLRLQAALDASPDPIALKDTDQRYRYVNRAYCAMVGRASDDVVGRGIDDLFAPDEAQRVRAHDRQCLETGQPARYEFARCVGDQMRWFEMLKVPMKGDDGEVTGIATVGHDITERKRREGERERESAEAMRGALERYRLATDAAGVWVFGIDLASDRLDVDEGAVRHLGYAAGEFPATSAAWRDRMVRPSHHALMRQTLARHLRGESGHYQFTAPVQDRAGREVWLQVRGRAERGADGRALRIVGTVHDVTERQRTREALEASEQRWQFALDGAGHGVWDWNAQTDRVFFSRRWKEMLGYAEHEVGDSLDEWKSRVHPDDLARCYAELERHFGGGTQTYVSEHRMRCRDGSWKWILDRGRVVERGADGRPARVIGTHTDIDPQKAAERALAEAAERQRAVLDNLLAGVIVIDERGTIEKFSRQAERIFGWTEAEVQGRNVSLLMPEAQARQHDDYLARHSAGGPAYVVGTTRELVGRRKDGREVPIELGVTEHRLGETRRYTGMIRDLTERRRAQQALADSEARFRQLFESSPDAVVVHASGWIESANRAAAALYGSGSAEELVGRNVLDFVDPAARARSGQRIAYLMEAPRRVPALEYRHFRMDGTELVVEATSSSFRQDGRLRVVTIYRDVTDRKRAADALAASERRLRQVLDLVPHPIYAKDRDGRYLLSNRAHAAFYGRTPEQMQGASVGDVGLSEADLAGTRGADARVWESRAVQRESAVARTGGDGRRREFDIVRMPFSYEGGGMDSVLGISIDVTELLDVQRELKAAVALLEATLETVDDGILVTDERRRIVRWNSVVPARLGLTEEALREGDYDAVFSVVRGEIANPGEVSYALPAIQADPRYAGATVARFRDGRYVERVTRPLEIEGRLAGRLWSYRDVTAREREKQAAALRAAELERMVAERTGSLEAALRDLDLFTSAVSHDLRAPLRAVDGFVHLALEEGDAMSADVRRHLGRVVAAVRTMSAMVEGLLGLARHARAAIQRQPVDLSALAREVAGELSASPSAPVEFRIADTPAVQADPVLMRVVLQNLIANAVKYSRDRHPAVVEFGAVERDGATEWFVRDNGAGFDPRFADKLFQPFGRLHSPREFEGTGIGLATVHRILERHGGGIRGEGRPGEGATFRFTIGAPDRSDN